MFKFTHVFLLLEMLIAASQGTELCSCSDIQTSQENYKSEVKELRDLVEDLRRTVQKAYHTKVAFFVGLNNNLDPVNKNTDIVFDNIVTNIGSAYSVSTGRFTAPVNGAYQFSLTIAAQHTKRASVVMSKNGLTILTVWSVATPWWAPSSEEAILWLKAGDQVWLQLIAGEPYVYGHMYTTFSGFLVFEK